MRYGDLVVCIDKQNPWYAHLGRVTGKNKENVGVAFEGDRDPPPTGRWLAKDAVERAEDIVLRDTRPTLCAIRVIDARVVKDTEIDLVGHRHLILTGPNGSGKSTILAALCDALCALLAVTGAQRASDAKVEPVFDRPRHEIAVWSRLALAPPNVIYLPPTRRFAPQEVTGPREIPWPELRFGADVADLLLQHLVNERTRQSFAREEGQIAEADAIAGWFDAIREQFRALTDRPDLELEFDRSKFRFGFRFGGREVPFHKLPDGFASLLSIWGTIALRNEAALRAGDLRPGGFVIIDEIETHLHLKLQQHVLPLLTIWFPTYQFLVATHAPAVLTSTDDALIFDLDPAGYTSVPSRDYLGREYGVLMTGHFGLSDDMDIDTANQLQRFRSLAAQPLRSPEEEQELSELGARLSARSEMLSTEVWRTLEYPKQVARR